MAGTKPKGDLRLTEKPGLTREQQLADVALDPLLGGAALVFKFSKSTLGETDMTALYEGLIDRAKAIRDNKLGSAEDMLTAQAAALNAMFLDLAQRSSANIGEYINAAEIYLRLALKAQAQCRATLETLANIKNPPVVYARQANIAHGPQQVNNGALPSHADKKAILPNELMESEHGQWLEPGATGATIGGDPALETVGAIDRTTNGGRQGHRQPQRRQGRKAASSQG